MVSTAGGGGLSASQAIVAVRTNSIMAVWNIGVVPRNARIGCPVRGDRSGMIHSPRGSVSRPGSLAAIADDSRAA
jgi:hypothetical protein